jgi:glucokinase
MEKNIVIGVDLGGTRIKLGAANQKGEIIKDINIAAEAEKGPETVVGNIIKGAKELIECGLFPKESVRGVGIGAPGSVDLDGGTVKYPPNFPNWGVVRLGEDVSRGLNGLNVEVDNDANAAAAGEAKFGAGIGTPNFFMLTLGTGVGGGIIIDGKVFRGVTGAAAELGHISIDYNGAQCNCGNKGCIEAYVGQRYFSKRTAEQLRDNPKSKILELINGDIDKLEPFIIFKAAEAGDKFAKDVLAEFGFYVGIAISSLINIFDFELAIVGGGISAAGSFIFDPMIKTAKERVLSVHKDKFKIVPAELGNRAGILGAAALVS